jgi:hypothetical protein
MSLTTHHLEFTCRAVTPVELEEQPGSSVRGAVVGGLWERFCANKAALSCPACPLVPVCPVAALIAPMREDGEPGGGQRPRPYVVRPPAAGPRRFAPGETLAFGIALIGTVAPLFPYVVMAAQAIEHAGLGRRLPAGGRRGTLHVEAIAAVHPLRGARQPLYRRGTPHVASPGLPVTPADVAAYAATLPSDRLTLRLLTPLRLVDGERLVRRFDPRPFLARLAWRLDELARAYGDGRPLIGPDAPRALAGRARVAQDATRWVDVISYSTRSRQRTPIGGLVGEVTLEGDLAGLRELLVWGSLVHVGRNAVKGDGAYIVVA